MRYFKRRYFFSFISIVLLIILGFKAENELSKANSFQLHDEIIVREPSMTFVMNQEESEDIKNFTPPPHIGKSYIGFKEALGFRESRGNYFVVNNYGYLGKYQFGESALKFYGIKDTKEFLNSPDIQERIFKLSLKRLKWLFHNEIKQYSGQQIGGVTITESGILAAAHLAGASNVKRFFRHKGNYSFRDAYGTSIRNYMKSFAHYDLSSIKAEEKPKI